MPALAFDASQVAPWTQSAFNFPLGDYPFVITAATLEQVKGKPNSGLLKLTLTVTDGQYKGMTHDTRFNLYNESEVSRRIAHQQLSSVCHVIGRLHIQDTQQLIGGRGIVTIGPQDGSDKYCEVKVWKDMQSRINGIGEPVPPPQAQAAPAAAPADASPWAAQPQQPAAQFPPAQAFQPQAPVAAQPPAPAPAAPAAPWATAPQQPQAPQPTAYAAQPAAPSATTSYATAPQPTAAAPAPAANPAAPAAPWANTQPQANQPAPPWAQQ